MQGGRCWEARAGHGPPYEAVFLETRNFIFGMAMTCGHLRSRKIHACGSGLVPGHTYGVPLVFRLGTNSQSLDR